MWLHAHLTPQLPPSAALPLLQLSIQPKMVVRGPMKVQSWPPTPCLPSTPSLQSFLNVEKTVSSVSRVKHFKTKHRLLRVPDCQKVKNRFKATYLVNFKQCLA